MTKYVPYTLSSEQVEALDHLLWRINLATLRESGRIIPHTDLDDVEYGKIIEKMFYDDKFALPEEED